MKEWADQYGPIYKLNIMGGTHIVLSTETAANDLLAMKGSIYSDRPHMTMAYELVSRSGNLATTPANKYWRNARRFGQTVLSSPAAANVWQPRQAAEAPRLALELLENPDRYGYLFELFATVLSLRQGFGKILPRGGPEEAYHVKMIMTITHTIEATSQPGAYIVDFIPALKYLPDFLAPFKAEARTLFDFEYSYFSQLFADARKRHEEGKSMDPPCFADTYFDKESFWDMSDFEATYAMATFYEGGSGTTSAAMQSFCLAMCHYPNWQTRLQEELDRVVGTDRLPAFDDMPNLPTVRAVVKEVLRWRPVVPGGMWIRSFR
jgi:cytochrome P450